MYQVGGHVSRVMSIRRVFFGEKNQVFHLAIGRGVWTGGGGTTVELRHM